MTDGQDEDDARIEPPLPEGSGPACAGEGDILVGSDQASGRGSEGHDVSLAFKSMISGLLCAALSSTVASADPGSVALVIGEAKYENAPPLPACAASAQAVAKRLREQGFEVEEASGDGAALRAALSHLSTKILEQHPSKGMIYYCGYASASQSRMFALTTSSGGANRLRIETDGVLLKQIAAAMKGATGLVAADLVRYPGTDVGSEDVEALQREMPQDVRLAVAMPGERPPGALGGDLAAGKDDLDPTKAEKPSSPLAPPLPPPTSALRVASLPAPSAAPAALQAPADAETPAAGGAPRTGERPHGRTARPVSGQRGQQRVALMHRVTPFPPRRRIPRQAPIPNGGILASWFALWNREAMHPASNNAPHPKVSSRAY